MSAARCTPDRWDLACVAAVLDALTRDTAKAGQQASGVGKEFAGSPAWTVVTAA